MRRDPPAVQEDFDGGLRDARLGARVPERTSLTIGTTAHFEGVVLSKTLIDVAGAGERRVG